MPWNQTPCIPTATNQQQDISPAKQSQLAPPPPPPPPPQKMQQQLQQHQQPQNMYNNNLPSSQQMDTGLQVNSQQQTANIINQQIQTSQAQQVKILFFYLFLHFYILSFISIINKIERAC